ncbi:MAG: MATE family efflux transporter [Deltaproteobacteria bacterium]|nr:MATE family efflux transporter [Deltaproteobacteria bacterium]
MTDDGTGGGATPAVAAGERPAREVIRLALPVVASMGAQSLMGLTDVLFMRWVGTAEQSAVGLGAVMSWTLLSLFTGTLSVVSTFVAQELGAGRPERTGSYVWQALWPVLPFAAVLPLTGPLARELLLLSGAPGDVAVLAARYVEIRMYASSFLFLTFAIVGFYRGLGQMWLPLWVTLGQLAANVAFNGWFVFGGGPVPALGLEGVAWATALVTVLGAAGFLAPFLSPSRRRTYGTWHDVAPRARRMRDFARIGAPVGASWMLEMVVWTAFAVFAATLGKVEGAAHNIVMQVVHVSFLPGIALSVAASTLVGQQLGAERPDAAERYARATLRVCLGYMGGMGLLFLLLRGPLAAGLAADGAVAELGARIFLFGAAFQVFDAVGIVCGGALRGAGDTRYPMVVSVALSWLVFLPAIWLFGSKLGWGLEGAWAGATLYLVVLAAFLYERFRRGSWKSRRVVERAAEPFATGTPERA